MVKVILASESPSRLTVLRRAGLDPAVQVSGLDESCISAGSNAQLVERLAHAKAHAVADGAEDGLIIGCDSLLELGHERYGKPETAPEAARLWRLMSGRSGVFTAGTA